jgi:hydrogenase maturation factor
MCLAIPGNVVSIEGDYAQVDFGGVTKTRGAWVAGIGNYK